MVIKEEDEASFQFLLLDKEMPFYCLVKEKKYSSGERKRGESECGSILLE